MNKVFFDTNILVYSVDGGDRVKQSRAREVLKKFTRHEGGVISTQVLQEYYAIVTGKLKVRPAMVKDLMKQLDYEIVEINPAIIFQAIDIQIDCRVSFWDALIVASAIEADCDRLFSEDLNHHQRIRSLIIENPFK